MESALEVLSRAATMVTANSDNRLTINKELPTTKWRRDRRIRLSSEYHSDNSVAVKPLGESNSGTLNENANMETPLDMTTTVSKIAAPPPPPYREPLPGSNFSRPSVITQAPKREISPGNQENKESFKKATIAANQTDNSTTTESISMVDPVIDEHFRRSLGADYMNLLKGKRFDNLKSPAPSIANPTPSPPAASPEPKRTLQAPSIQSTPSPPSQTRVKFNAPNKMAASSDKAETEDVEMSVDDHFAKALGDTWKQLQQQGKPIASASSASPSPTAELIIADDDNDDDDDDAEDSENESHERVTSSSSPAATETKKQAEQYSTNDSNIDDKAKSGR